MKTKFTHANKKQTVTLDEAEAILESKHDSPLEADGIIPTKRPSLSGPSDPEPLPGARAAEEMNLPSGEEVQQLVTESGGITTWISPSGTYVVPFPATVLQDPEPWMPTEDEIRSWLVQKHTTIWGRSFTLQKEGVNNAIAYLQEMIADLHDYVGR